MFKYEDIPLHWVNRLGFLSRKELGQRFKDAGYDISPEEWAVLLMLWTHGGQTPGAISAGTLRDPTTITRLVDNMVHKSLVTRTASSTDRRKSIIKISTLGDELKDKIIPIAQDFIEKSVANIDADDLETTVRTLRKMTANLSENTS